MGPVLILVGLAGLLFGLGNAIRPSGRLRIDNRRRATAVVVGSFLVLSVGLALLPPPETPAEDAPAAEDDPTVAADTFPANEPAPPTTALPPTTTLPPAVSTAPLESTTTAPRPLIPDADVVFAIPTSGPSGDPAATLPEVAEIATVVRIVDGDTVDVALTGGADDTVRLIGTNSPEQGECFAAEASQVLGILIPVGSRAGMTVDSSDRDQFDRLLRYLWVGSMSVNEEMVRRGAAISRRYPPDTAMADRLESAQAEAQVDQLGLWQRDACGPDAGTEIVVVDIEADAPGDDHQNLNAEHVRLRNDGDLGVDMSGWVLKDESAGHRYEFPAGFTLNAGAIVTIHSGCGHDDMASLYWCSAGAIWNNDGDTAFIRDENGNTVDALSYTPSPSD